MFGTSFENNGKVVPFCAAGLSWVATTLYAEQAQVGDRKNHSLQPYLLEVRQRHFYPTPSVVNMQTVASIEGKWVARTSATGTRAPRKGWLVVYNWDGKRPDHVGIIDSVEPGWLNTVEFNTSDKDNRNGGAIAMRHREINHTVEGYIRT
jgi:CHAP domain